MHELGRVSIFGFLLGLPLFVIGVIFNVYSQVYLPLFYGCSVFAVAGVLSLFIDESTRLKMQVFYRSFFLGWAFSCGALMISGGFVYPFGIYVCVLTHFHFSEFLITSVINPSTLSLDSFLLNHSTQYGIAAVASWIEFFIEIWCFPWLKSLWISILMGVMLCVGGEILRKLAMLTAHRNFTHLVRHEKVEDHELITHGLYSLCRHPAYAGWFWWSLGTQLILVNPICFAGYTFATYQFFKDRIYYEEFCLQSFFPNKYQEYQTKVRSTGVPFVEGYYSS